MRGIKHVVVEASLALICALIEITHSLVRTVPLHLLDLVGEVVPEGRSATPVAILERARVREVVGVENT